MGKKTKGAPKQPAIVRYSDGTKALMPPSKPGWTSYPEALSVLSEYGWRHARFAPLFSSRNMCKEIQTLLCRNVEVVDATNMIPVGPNASHSVLAKVYQQLCGETRLDNTKIAIILRTQENTPAFVGGSTQLIVAQEGDLQKAMLRIKGQTCSSIVVILGGEKIDLPSVCVQGTHSLAARVVAAIINRDETAVKCELCLESFLEVPLIGAVGIVPFVASNCDHCFHPDCILNYMRNTSSKCYVCGEQLPDVWLPDPKLRPVEPAETVVGPNRIKTEHELVDECMAEMAAQLQLCRRLEDPVGSHDLYGPDSLFARVKDAKARK
jgi:hypothetical protein